MLWNDAFQTNLFHKIAFQLQPICVSWFRWKELELAASEPNRTNQKPETAVSRWARAGTKAAKVILLRKSTYN